MPKKTLLLSTVLTLLFTLFVGIDKTYATTLSISPITVDVGNTIQITVGSLPIPSGGIPVVYELDISSPTQLLTGTSISIHPNGTCTIGSNPGALSQLNCQRSGDNFNLTAQIVTSSGDLNKSGTYQILLSQAGQQIQTGSFIIRSINSASLQITSISPNPASLGDKISISLSNAAPNTLYTVELQSGNDKRTFANLELGCNNDCLEITVPSDITLDKNAYNPNIIISVINSTNQKVSNTLIIKGTPIPDSGGFTANDALKNSVIKSKCNEDDIKNGRCTSAAGITCNDDHGILTAIGCVPTEPKELIAGILRISTGAGGGIALLLMIFGAFQMITSAGSADALKAGQERFKDAIIGLLFIIFSVLLLQIIGVDILNIPGFSR
jgi:hypothetical protein